MAARKGGLGRGLDALIPQDHPMGGFADVPVKDIDPNPKQPRSDFDQAGLDSLAASISAVGLLQPIVVRAEGTRYVLVAGERRLRAAKQAGLATIPAVIRDATKDESNLTEALIENLQRQDLTALEEAAAFNELLEDYGMTHEQVAEQVGRSRSAVTNTVRLLQLPAPIQAMLASGALSAGHARALLGSEDDTYAIHIAERAVAEGWTVRRVEEAIRLRGTQGRGGTSTATTSVRPAAIIELEDKLQEKLGTKVKIDYRGKGGRITIRYASSADLERIYRHLFGE
ncbi:MAG: ParB/RepB/Spo0J family partition protein [Acidimicrobiia bacterium]|nr:ParB/RepB/Spo0J family partition protein [Acidimicrobiia bacterium]